MDNPLNDHLIALGINALSLKGNYPNSDYYNGVLASEIDSRIDEMRAAHNHNGLKLCFEAGFINPNYSNNIGAVRIMAIRDVLVFDYKKNKNLVDEWMNCIKLHHHHLGIELLKICIDIGEPSADFNDETEIFSDRPIDLAIRSIPSLDVTYPNLKFAMSIRIPGVVAHLAIKEATPLALLIAKLPSCHFKDLIDRKVIKKYNDQIPTAGCIFIQGAPAQDSSNDNILNYGILLHVYPECFSNIIKIIDVNSSTIKKQMAESLSLCMYVSQMEYGSNVHVGTKAKIVALIDSGANLNKCPDPVNNKLFAGGNLLHELCSMPLFTQYTDDGVLIHPTDLPRSVAKLLAAIDRTGKLLFDVNAADDDGNTALHKAALQGSTLVTSVLIEAGADLSSKNNLGRIPIDFVQIENPDIYKLLASANAKKIVQDLIKDSCLKLN
jgi:hypothetical protein